MKKTITGAVALLAGACVAYSQGTVFFGNYGDLSPYIYVTYKGANIGGSAASTGVAANDVGSGSSWSVGLYGAPGAGAAESSLALLNTAASVPVVATLETGSGADSTPGTWYTGAIGVIPNSGGAGFSGAGNTVSIQIDAWYNDGGTIGTYAAAVAAGVPVGQSLEANYTTGGPAASGPPATAPEMSPAALGNIVVSTPEPSTVALGVMGASAFLLRLRRKK